MLKFTTSGVMCRDCHAHAGPPPCPSLWKTALVIALIACVPCELLIRYWSPWAIALPIVGGGLWVAWRFR